MNTARTSPLDGVPDMYDALAGVVALIVLVYEFFVAFMPLQGLLFVGAFLSVYAVARTGDRDHAAVVAGCWLLVFVGLLSLGLQGVFLGLILAVVCYVGWRVLTGRVPG